jgi:septal ring factor EnvC (AmiA/AmiB activator)
MKYVNRLLPVLLICLTTQAWSQSSEKLKNEQRRLERKIADTKLLLKKSKSNTSASLNELKVIDNQITFREQLLRNYDNQIRGAELKVESKEKQIETLKTKLVSLKSQYKKLLLYAYKHRNKYGKMMYIFSAESYYEAVKRNKYLAKIADIQKKQFILIQQHQALIAEEIGNIEDEKALKLSVIDEKKKEKEEIQADRVEQEKIYNEFKQEEELILARLKKEQRDRAVLKERIAAAIRKEIAEAEARRKAEAAKNKPTASTSGTAAATTSFAETKESAALSKNFEGNKGRLPWPVEKGTVTEKE